MKWVLLYLTFVTGWSHVTPQTTVLAEYQTKAECEEHAKEIQKHLSGGVFCGEKP